MTWTIVLDVVLLAAAAAVAIGAMFCASGGQWTEEMLLLVIPYEVLFILGVLLYLVKPIRAAVVRSACVTSFLVLGFTIFAYGGAVFGSSSTGAIAFLVAPFCILIGAPMILVIGVAIGMIVSQRTRAPESLHCRKCGYFLVGLTEARCPECGQTFPKDWLDEPAE